MKLLVISLILALPILLFSAELSYSKNQHDGKGKKTRMRRNLGPNKLSSHEHPIFTDWGTLYGHKKHYGEFLPRKNIDEYVEVATKTLRKIQKCAKDGAWVATHTDAAGVVTRYACVVDGVNWYAYKGYGSLRWDFQCPIGNDEKQYQMVVTYTGEVDFEKGKVITLYCINTAKECTVNQ